MKTSTERSLRVRLACATALLLGACSGSNGTPAGPLDLWQDNIVGDDGGTDHPDDSEDAGDPDDPEDPGDLKDPEPPTAADCFAQLVANKEVRAKLDVCRSCHVAPRGIAAKSSFLLTTDRTMDAARLRAAFGEVGQDLLAMPAEEGGLKHPGGKRLVKGTPAYDAWKAMVEALDDPQSCGDSP